MAVTITDTRTTPDEADATTGWASDTGAAITLFTANPNPVEDSGCLGIAASTATENLRFTITAADLSDTLIYVWCQPNGVMDTLVNGGVAIVVGDATPDTIGYHVGGSDVAGFRHSDGPIAWQCFLIDTANLPANTTALVGTVGGLDFTVLTQIGAMYKTLAKALGGVSNCFTDVIRYGTDGLVVAGGTTGARGNFDEIATDDRASTTGKGYGICRELGASLFGLQGPLTFGLAVSNADHWFQDTNVTIAFEDRGIGTARYFFNLAANTTDAGHFQLGLISGSDGGSDGCNVIVPAGVGGSMDFSDADFDFVGLYASTFTGFDGGVLFSDDATNGITHDVFACTFTLCGTINPGRVDMSNCAVVNSSATTAMLLEDSDNTLLNGIDFQSDDTGHAIEITHTGAGPHTLTLTGHSYTGYASVDGSTGNEVILYNPGTSSANITITVAGSGDTPTVMKAGGVTGTVTIVNNKTITFDGMKDNSEVWVFPTGVRGEGNEIAHIENATAGSPDNRNFAWVAAGGASVDYKIHNFDPNGIDYKPIQVNNFTVPNVDSTIGIQQQVDLNSGD